MRLLLSIAFLAILCSTSSAQSQNITAALDMIKQICIYGSSSEKLSVSVSGKGEVSLLKLSSGGQVQGEVKFDKSNVQGLVLGMNNEISSLSADQANQMRACGQPFLKQLVDALLAAH